MKSILVIDTPNTCFSCPCYSRNARANRFECDAKLFIKGRIGVLDLSTKPNWCPLKPMPQRKYEGKGWTEYYDVAGDYLKAQGYNKCIDEILEGEE